MVQSDELRFGNLLTWQDEEDDSIFLKVIGFCSEDLWIEDTEGDVNDVSFDSVRPIQLTPEILKKCGYTINISKTAWWDKCDQILIGQLDGKFYYSTWGGTSGKPLIENIIELTSIHQFQNLYFALTNQELEVNP